MFTKFDDFINEAKRFHKSNMVGGESLNEAFATKDIERVLTLAAKYIGKYTKTKVSKYKIEHVKRKDVVKPLICYKFYLGDGRSFRLNWTSDNTASTQMHSFSIYKVSLNPINTVVIPSGFGIGVILPTIVKALRDPYKDINIQDFVNAASMRGNLQESFGFLDTDFGISEDFELDGDVEITYTIDETVEFIGEGRVSALSDVELARRDELKAMKKRDRTPEQEAELQFLLAAGSDKALYAYDVETLLDELRTNSNGVFFKFIKKSGDGNETRLAHGTLNPELLQQNGVKPPKTSSDTEFDGKEIKQKHGDNSPLITYFDLYKKGWRTFDRGSIVAKQTKSATKPATKPRTLTAEERLRRNMLQKMGIKKRNPAEEAELQTLLNKQAGIATVVTEQDVKVENLRGAKEKDLAIAAQIEKADKIMKFLGKYGGNEAMDSLERNTLLLAKNRRRAILVTGQAGVGKTYTITSTLESVGLKKNIDYVKISGKATTSAIYEALYRYRNKIILFDDCDSVFEDADARNLLKAALDTSPVREVSYFTPRYFVVDDMTQEDIAAKYEQSVADGKTIYPQAFEYTGRVIFISNLPTTKMEPALLSRSLTIDIQFTADEMRNRLRQILPKMSPEFSMEVKQAAFDLFDGFVNKGLVTIMDSRALIKAFATVESLLDSVNSGEMSETIYERLVFVDSIAYYADIQTPKGAKYIK